MTVYWDLDGVLRNLVAGYEAAQEGEIHIEKWSDLDVSRVSSEILENAPPTEYLDMILDLYNESDYDFHIASCQPAHWRKSTNVWINRFIGSPDVTYFSSSKEKASFCKNDILVEDSPNLQSYRNICLVRRPWNEAISIAQCFHVVRNPIGMYAFLVVCRNIHKHENRISAA